jgi:Family of unknown function (DUF6508)
VRISRASLRILAGYAEAFAPNGAMGRRRGGEAERVGDEVQMPWYEYPAEVSRFVADMEAAKIVRQIDWTRWAGTPEGQRLISDPSAIASASHDDLIYLTTTIIRGERFSDGEIAGAYERGTLLAIAERARALLGADPGEASGAEPSA